VDFCSWVLLCIVRVASRVGPVEVPRYLTVFLVAGTALLLVCILAKRRRSAAVAAGIAALLVVLPSPVERMVRDRGLEGRMCAVFLDVGQGDATYFRAPDGTGFLVDAGPAHPNLGRDAPLPRFLRAWGVDALDSVIVSHPHADHYGGLSDLLREGVKVERVFTGATPDDPGADEGWADLLLALGEAGARVTTVRGCGDLDGLGVDAEVLYPCEGAPEGDANDRSLVTRLCHGGTCILMTGDIGAEVENHLVSTAPHELGCNVLKVPHHGSKHSSSPGFLRAVSSEVAVVSSREGNVHGFPHEDVLGRLGTAGITVRRIDREGGWMFVGRDTGK
jgi:competence protein ComEC